METPPKCSFCGTEWEEVKSESSEFHEVFEPVCDCYNEDIRLSVG